MLPSILHVAEGGSASGWKGTLAATLTAVNTVADHLEAGCVLLSPFYLSRDPLADAAPLARPPRSGKTLLDSGSKSASQVIHHKYGAEARGVADDVGSSVKRASLSLVLALLVSPDPS